MPAPLVPRRKVLFIAGAALSSSPRTHAARASQADDTSQAEHIERIDKITLRRNRDGQGKTWFHPRACLMPGTPGPAVLMTLQEIAGSDFFGPVHFITSPDLGQSWTEPALVPSLGCVRLPSGTEEGVCDVVPEWHPPSKSILALGHNVFYTGPRFNRDQPPRWPIYSVFRNGAWGPRERLEWHDPRGAYIYTNNCGQRVTLPSGDVLLAFTFGARQDQPRSVASVLCSFDGEKLAVRRVGEPLHHAAGRGLLEPSLVAYRDRFYLTLRAEDGRGYVAASHDGLSWSPKQAWAWQDGEPLDLSTTQQHWLAHSQALWLVYTRKHPSNVNVIRWRSPLWMARVDLESLRLVRSTERVVLPLVGDGVREPNLVAEMGNFHVTSASPRESWVTVGEWQARNANRGDLLLARIIWKTPNRLHVDP